jgi:hypothetical protein
MKKLVLTAILTLSTINAFASQIDCFDQESGKNVLFIADDYGSITTGGMTIGKKVYSFSDEYGYSYFYGEYLSINQKIDGDEVVVVAVRTANNKFLGKISINSYSSNGKFFNIVCNE